MEDEVPEEIKHVKGYHKYWRGEKGGKAGVALLSKVLNDFHLERFSPY